MVGPRPRLVTGPGPQPSGGAGSVPWARILSLSSISIWLPRSPCMPVRPAPVGIMALHFIPEDGSPGRPSRTGSGRRERTFR